MRPAAPLRPLPDIERLVAAGCQPDEIVAVLARWALLALPAADGTCLIVQTPVGIIAGSAGVADTSDVGRHVTHTELDIAACPPIVVGEKEIGSLNVYVCHGTRVDDQFGWAAALTAGIVSQLVAAALKAIDWGTKPVVDVADSQLTPEVRAALRRYILKFAVE